MLIKYRNQISLKGDKPKAKVAISMDSSSLAKVVDRIFDRGIGIDALVRVLLVGIELLTNPLPAEKIKKEETLLAGLFPITGESRLCHHALKLRSLDFKKPTLTNFCHLFFLLHSENVYRVNQKLFYLNYFVSDIRKVG